MASTKKKKSNKIPPSIKVHYIKTNNYRSYHVDGIFGGITPKGNIYCELFVERQVTPQQITYKIGDGKLGKEIERASKDGIVRQVECGISLDIQTAYAFKNWLEEKINEYNKKILPIKDKDKI